MDMTPAELEWKLEGVTRREERRRERTAMLASWLLAAWVKHPPSVDKLLGRVVAGKKVGERPVRRNKGQLKD